MQIIARAMHVKKIKNVLQKLFTELSVKKWKNRMVPLVIRVIYANCL